MISAHDRLLSRLPEYSHEYIDAALAGDEEAAQHLVFEAPNNQRPWVLLSLHSVLGARHPAVTTALSNVWNHDHQYLIFQLGSRLTWTLLKDCGTRTHGTPKKITVWRGGIGSPALIKRGFSWTTDKRIAAFFVEYWKRRSPIDGPPCVVRAEILSSRIVHVEDGRQESEVVIRGARNAVVDGTPEEWAQLADDLAAERKREAGATA